MEEGVSIMEQTVNSAIISAVISSIFAGVFGLIGKALSSQSAKSSFNVGKSLIHVGVIQLIANIAGFIIGALVGSAMLQDPTATLEDAMDSFILVALIVGSILLIVCFAVSGSKVDRAHRWQHLFFVAAGVMVSTLLINYFLLNTVMGADLPLDFQTLAVSAIQPFVCMVIGGWIADSFSP
jgi:MFS family permease